MNTPHTDNTDHVFIADLGESPSVFINGKDEPVYRYAVWNETKIKIIEYGDNLKYLRDKYGHDKPIRVLKYSPIREEQL